MNYMFHAMLSSLVEACDVALAVKLNQCLYRNAATQPFFSCIVESCVQHELTRGGGVLKFTAKLVY